MSTSFIALLAWLMIGAAGVAYWRTSGVMRLRRRTSLDPGGSMVGWFAIVVWTAIELGLLLIGLGFVS